MEALELAFKAIDTESQREHELSITSKTTAEPIYENIDEINELYQEIENDEKLKSINNVKAVAVQKDITTINNKNNNSNIENKKDNKNVSKVEDEEPFYQIPKCTEPYYQVPKPKPVPLYENVEIVYSSSNMKYPIINDASSALKKSLEPPKEKPPPPPVDNSTDDDEGNRETEDDEKPPQDPMKRMNSTKRIKKEIRNKRTSFLGIEGNMEDESFLELSVAPPPDMAAFIQEERRLEKQMYIKAGLYDSSTDTTDSRDSGVSENHSRQSSEPLTTSSEEQDDFIAKQEKEIIKVLENEERRHSSTDEFDGINRIATTENWKFNDSFRNENEIISNRLTEEARMRCLEDQIREQEEVLRVERELLQLEQEELKRQRENLMLRENMARKELDHGAKMLMSANRHSLQDINSPAHHYVNVPNHHHHHQNQQAVYQMHTDYRQSMPNLQEMSLQEFTNKRVPPTPPAKPMRTHLSHEVLNGNRDSTVRHSRMPSADGDLEIVHSRNHSAPIQIRNGTQQNGTAAHYGNMTKHTLHELSAVPKPKFHDGWVQNKEMARRRQSDFITNESYLRKGTSRERIGDTWMAIQQKRKSDPQNFNYNKHWLIQEAEQRRIDQQRGVRPTINGGGGWSTHNVIQRNGIADNKPLPDAVIQTLTQRVQSRGIGERKKYVPLYYYFYFEFIFN